MMAHACSSRTNGLTFVVPIDIDKGYRSVEPLADKELAKSTYLLGCECLFGMGISPHGTIDVVPQIGGSFTCHPLDVLMGNKFVVISLADAGCHTEDKSSLAASTNASECTLIDLVALTAAVAFFLQTFNADEGCDIACSTELLGDIVGEEGAIGEELKVAVTVLQEEVEQPPVKKRFTTQDTEESGSVTIALADDTVNLLYLEVLPSSLADPTAAAGEIAGFGDRNHVEGREEGFAPLLPPLKVTHIPQVRPAEIPAELPQEPERGLAEHSPADFQQ